MKPLSRPLFLSLIIGINALFLFILIWWIWFMIGSFKTITAPYADTTNTLPTLSTETLDKLVPPSATPNP